MTKFAWMCATEVYPPEELIEQARLAEEIGFDAIVVPDAFFPWTDEGASTLTWSWLGAVAAVTQRIQLVTTVTAPLLRYHPAVIAQGAATLDRMSRGRFILGLGTGHPLHDASLGFGVVGTHERLARLDEAARLIRSLLSGEPVTFEGTYYRLDNARLYSPPLHAVPILIAAAGPQSAGLAGRLGDGLITSVKEIATTRDKIVEPFLAAADDAEFQRLADPIVIATRWVVMGRSVDEAWESLGPLRGLRLPSRDRLTDPGEMRQQADEAGAEAILAGFAIVADLDDVVAEYASIVEELRPDYLSIQLASTDPMGALRHLGRAVLPRLRNI